MNSEHPQFQPSSTRAEVALQTVVGAFASNFPGRVRACYVAGSYADGSAVTTSDLDITVIFRGAFGPDETEAAKRLSATLTRKSAIELDIEVCDEASLARGASPNLKLGSALISGEDIRDDLPLISLMEWTRDRMHTSWWRVARLFARPAVISLPLGYPEPEEPFRGYTRRTLRLPSGEERPCTRDLIRLIGWAATGLLALRAGVYAARKSESHVLYRECVGDKWTLLIEDIYAMCRTRWNYLIPEEPEERERLRALCDQTLDFERSFVAQYREYLLSEMSGADVAGVRFAAEVMGHAPLRDDTVVEALDAITRGADTESATLARAALAQMSTHPN